MNCVLLWWVILSNVFVVIELVWRVFSGCFMYWGGEVVDVKWRIRLKDLGMVFVWVVLVCISEKCLLLLRCVMFEVLLVSRLLMLMMFYFRVSNWLMRWLLRNFVFLVINVCFLGMCVLYFLCFGGEWWVVSVKMF